MRTSLRPTRLPAAAAALTLAFVASAVRAADAQHGPGVPPFWVRSGYRVTVAAQNFGEARFIEFDDKGTLYVSQPRGSIVALRDKDGDGVYETKATFISGKPTVHGMHFYKGWLWFTQSGAIYKGRDTNDDGVADAVVTVIPDGQLPKGGGHWWRSILVTDDGFYTSIGDTENASDHRGDDREKIWHYDLDGGNKKLFCSGIRNTEKLRLRPGTNEVWGADHGSDNFGQPVEKSGAIPQGFSNQALTDLMPPEEFNHYTQDGFFGHPFVMGNRLPRYEFLNKPDINIADLIARTIPATWSFPAHWAPNGWTFLTKDYFPGQQGDAFIAFHGSWNSTKKVGYCVERVLFDKETGNPYGELTVVSALDKNGQPITRPVDCAEAADGTVLFTCDDGRIYRISRVP